MALGIVSYNLAALTFACTACFLGSIVLLLRLECIVGLKVHCCSHVIDCLSTNFCSCILPDYTAGEEHRSFKSAAGELRITAVAEA